MMGIFGALGKVLAGKPVYSSEDQSLQQEGGQLRADQQPAVQTAQPDSKVIPMIRFGRIENQWDGPSQAVYADAENESTVPVFLDWVTVVGARRQLDIQLRPGEVRQLLIYTGPRLQDRPDGYAELQYRTAETGDYFINYHEIRSERQEELGWRVTEILQRGPVKDLH